MSQTSCQYLQFSPNNYYNGTAHFKIEIKLNCFKYQMELKQNNVHNEHVDLCMGSAEDRLAGRQ